MEVSIALIFVLAAGIAAVEALSLEAALASFAAAGLGISVAFLLAGAPLVSLLILIAETIVITLLVKVSAGDTSAERFSLREKAGSIISLLFIAAAAYYLYLAFAELPAAGTIHPRLAIGERGLDEMVASAALLAAALGALAVLRKGAKKEK